MAAIASWRLCSVNSPALRRRTLTRIAHTRLQCFSSSSKSRHQPNGQQAPTEAFLEHLKRMRGKLSSVIARQIGPLPTDSLVSGRGRQQALQFMVDCVYALDNALRFLVSKIWAGALRSTTASAASPASGSFGSKLKAYYTRNPYEVLYHSIGVFVLAWLAWEKCMNLPLPQQQAFMQASVLSALQLSKGRIWTLLSGPFIQPDALVAGFYGVLGALYGSRVVTYVGPWYALQLAVAGTAASSALFLATAGAFKWLGASSDDSNPSSASQSVQEAPGFVPSSASSLTTAQRAFNILKYGTHEAPGTASAQLQVPLSFANALFQFPHVGPAAAVSALAAFAVAAKPNASWELWRGLRIPVALPAAAACAGIVGTMLAAPPAERTSDAAHLLGGGVVGAAWLWALRRGHVRYQRFWPKQ